MPIGEGASQGKRTPSQLVSLHPLRRAAAARFWFHPSLPCCYPSPSSTEPPPLRTPPYLYDGLLFSTVMTGVGEDHLCTWVPVRWRNESLIWSIKRSSGLDLQWIQSGMRRHNFLAGENRLSALGNGFHAQLCTLLEAIHFFALPGLIWVRKTPFCALASALLLATVLKNSPRPWNFKSSNVRWPGS